MLYNKHALYTYTGEELAGPGTKALGGTWFFISPEGEPVESTAGRRILIAYLRAPAHRARPI